MRMDVDGRNFDIESEWRLKVFMENKQNRNNGKKPGNQNIGVLSVILLVTLLVVSLMNSQLRKSQTEQVGYIEFLEMIDSGEVDHVKYQGNRYYIIPKASSTQYSRLISYYTIAIADPELVNRLDEAGSEAFKIDRSRYNAPWEALTKAREDYYESTEKVLLKDL